MRTIILIMLSIIPFYGMAQKPTTDQQQAALQSARQFCELLTRFSEGQRTLDTQINALCSGADCSAFDDIKSNKEVTLRNYLMAIQQKFPKKLEMTISAPSLSDATFYIEPRFSMTPEWQNKYGSVLSVAQGINLSLESIGNYYIVFNVVQRYPSLGTSINKKIIYDVNAKKITAFITNSGAWINFLNGLTEYSKGNYQSAMNYFDIAAQNDRSSLKKGCYSLALMSAIRASNFEKATKYAELYGDPLLTAMLKVEYLIQCNKYNETYPYILEIESLLKTRPDLINQFKSDLYLTLANAYVNPLCSFHDTQKALSYISMAQNLGNAAAGYMAYVYSIVLEEEDLMPAKEAYQKLRESAKAGFPPAFYMWAYNLERVNEMDEALIWYAKAADAGNHRAMARLGKALIDEGDEKNGTALLICSLKGNALENEINDMELSFGLTPFWPKSREDVESLLRQLRDNYYSQSNNTSTGSSSSISSGSANISSTQSNSSYNHSTTQSSNSYNTPTSTYNSSSSTTTSYSNHSTKHRFNSPKEDYVAGWSIGYVRKEWRYHFPGHKEGVNVFANGKYTNGLQTGLMIIPQFDYGFGLNFGIFYEYYSDKSDEIIEDGIKYHCTAKEHSMYFPFHLKYSLNFSKWFQLSFHGGIGLDWGLKGKIYLKSEGETINSQTMYDDELDMKRFNTSLEYGASLRINHVQFTCTMSRGLRNMSGNADYKVKMNKLLSLSIACCF